MFADVLCLPQTFTSDFLAGALAGAYVCSRSVKLGQAELINIHEASSPSAHTSRVVIRPMAYMATCQPCAYFFSFSFLQIWAYFEHETTRLGLLRGFN